MFGKDFLNGEVSINDFYFLQSNIWNKLNNKLFGLSVCHLSSMSSNIIEINETLREDQKNFWNEGTCDLKEHLLTTTKFKGREYMLKNTWSLEYNRINNLIGLSALFVLPSNNVDNGTKNEIVKTVEKINKLSDSKMKKFISSDPHEFDGKNYVVNKIRIALFPQVTGLGYKIKNSEYALRTQAVRNKYLLRKISGVVKQKGWEYYESCEDTAGNWVPGEFEDGENHFKDVHECNYPLLNAILGEQVTEDNFMKALDLMPEYDKDSVLYFDFKWFEEVERAVINCSKVINAEKGKIINYAGELNAPKKYSNSEMRDLCTNLVRIKNKLKALEVSRTVLFAIKGDHAPTFSFHDGIDIFDAFKVTTNGLAGRIRVLLDNIYIDNGMMKIDYKGKTYNQYDIVFGNVHKDLKSKNKINLSCLSKARYNYLNDAKRIMFCSKLRGQAVPVTGQIDDLTHEVPARVVFADWEGYSFGDSFVISESFAKKLECYTHERVHTDKETIAGLMLGEDLTIEDLVAMGEKNKYSSFRDIKLTNIMQDEIEVTARIPFGVGDKITNMHGSKGIVSLILPDDQMPILQNDLSKNFKAGPVDVIIPGISVYRRKSTGQLFEAVTRALGIGEIPFDKLESKYMDKIKEFEKNSKFKFMGQTFKAPCGINHFIKLDHDAYTKQSFAYIKSNYNFNLHVAEMELLNLASRGYYNILNELDIRSLNKHSNSYYKIRRMQETGAIDSERSDTAQLYNYMRTLGWEFQAFGAMTKDDIDSRLSDLLLLNDIIDNEEIDLFD